MDATPLLGRIAAGLSAAKLEAILIGNAAAALHGAPVTTIDFDFMFRKTPLNLRKLKVFADHVGAVILRPYYQVSDLFRVVADDSGLQVDFMSAVHGVKSFNSLRSRANRVQFGGHPIWLADLADTSRARKLQGGRGTKRFWVCYLKRLSKSANRVRQRKLAALKKESQRDLKDLVRRRLALPMEARTNFLRVRLPGGGSCL